MNRKRRITAQDDDLDDDMFSCPVCFENFGSSGDKLPRIFPCSHTACHECIKRLIKYTGVSLHNKNVLVPRAELVCPKCQKVHRAYTAKSFPENPYVMKMVGDLEKRQVEEFQLCNNHNRELSFYCNDSGCNTAICSLCLVKSHLNHNVIDLIEEHRDRLETRIAFLNSCQTEQELVRNKSKDSLKTLMKMKKEYMNKFDSMITDVETNVAQAESNIEHLKDELKKLDDMKKDVANTDKAAQKDIQSVKNDVVNQTKTNPSCSYLEYQACSSTDHPCGQLVRKKRLFVTFAVGDETNGK